MPPWCAARDSNPEHLRFERNTSANWASRALMGRLEGIEPSASRFGAGCTVHRAADALVAYRGIEPRVMRLEGARPSQRVGRGAPRKTRTPRSGFVAQTPDPLVEANGRADGI
jgi:hypothetical protein